MATNTSEKRGGLRGLIAPSDEDLYQARKAEELEGLAQRFEQLTDVHNVGRGLWADDTGRLWRQDRSFGDHKPDSAFTVGADLEAIWFERPQGGPQTLEQWEVQQARRAKAAEQQERERQARLKELRRVALPVTLGHLDPACRMPLAEAGEQISNLGGKLEVRNGRLVVSLPPGATNSPNRGAAAARILYAAETL